MDANLTDKTSAFINSIYELHGDKYTVLGEYVNSITPILVRHNECGTEFMIKEHDLKKLKSCRHCHGQKTHDKFLKELAIKNPKSKDIEILDEYTKAHNRIKCRCKLCGYEWSPKAYKLLSGRGCKNCYTNSFMSKEQFLEEVSKRDLNIELVGEYISKSKATLMRCTVCGREWSISPSSILNGTRCNDCVAKEIGVSKIAKHKKDFDERKHLNTNVIVLGEYTGKVNSILCKCVYCGEELYMLPDNILNGNTHAKCKSIQRRLSNDEFVGRIALLNPTYELLTPYIRSEDKIKCRCKIHDFVWESYPSTLLKGGNCPRCSGKYQWSTENFKKEMFIINPDIEILGEYINTKTNILARCIPCDYTWSVGPRHLLTGRGCPKCSMSRGERKVSNFLKEHNIDFQIEYKLDGCKVKRELPFDFVIFNDGVPKVAIEYQGIQHYEPLEFFGGEDGLEKRKYYDDIKREYCISNNIKLIEIPYWDYNNIELILAEELNLY